MKWCFYAYAGLMLLSVAVVGLLFAFLVGFVSFAGHGHHGPPADARLGVAMVGTVFGLVLAILLAKTVAVFFAARFIGERSHYLFIFVIAIICTLNMPFGTALGIFALITLMKDPVKQRFGV